MPMHPLIKPLAVRLGKRVLVGVLEEAIKVAEGRLPVVSTHDFPPRQAHPERPRVFFQPTGFEPRRETPLHKQTYQGMKDWAKPEEAEPGAKPWT